LDNPPEKFWHCAVKLQPKAQFAVENDLTYADLDRKIVRPWLTGRQFTIAGTIISAGGLKDGGEIKITHTPEPAGTYADRHYARMQRSGIADLATNSDLLPLGEGEDHTFDLLFSSRTLAAPEPDVELVVRVCQRLPQTARILANRSRKGKQPFDISDEYDVQDLLHGVLRGYLKYSVQEDPLPKVAGAKSSRIDISIEELGVLIEVKYVHGPDNQKRIFEEYSQDLVLYTKWPHLKTLIFLIYNSGDLRDPEAFGKLGGKQDVEGKRFDVRMVLA
jgi:hypothetical protein